MDVQVVNKGKKDFPLQYNSQLYLVRRNSHRWVPEEALTPQLGYVGAVNTAKHKRREEEVTRLRILYGVYDDDAAWETKKSDLSIEVYDHEGERIWTPLDDPAGTNVRVVDDMDEKDRLEATVASLIARLDQIEGRVGAGPRARPDAPDDDVDVQLSQPTPVVVPLSDAVGDDDEDLDDDDLDSHLNFVAPEDSPTIIPIDSDSNSDTK